jgi:hypothetical protein
MKLKNANWLVVRLVMNLKSYYIFIFSSTKMVIGDVKMVTRDVI